MNYISFPKVQTSQETWYIKNDEDTEFRINENAKSGWSRIKIPIIKGQIDCCINIWNFPDFVIYDNCFSNQHIYEYSVCVPNRIKEICMKHNPEERDRTADCYMDSNKAKRERDVYASKDWHLRNQVLYQYLCDNLLVGEFVELYEFWTDHDDEHGICFDSPTAVSEITLKELRTRPFSRECIGFDERKKLIIRKTE